MYGKIYTILEKTASAFNITTPIFPFEINISVYYVRVII